MVFPTDKQHVLVFETIFIDEILYSSVVFFLEDTVPMPGTITFYSILKTVGLVDIQAGQFF
jgi:hypothetical protein